MVELYVYNGQNRKAYRPCQPLEIAANACASDTGAKCSGGATLSIGHASRMCPTGEARNRLRLSCEESGEIRFTCGIDFARASFQAD